MIGLSDGTAIGTVDLKAAYRDLKGEIDQSVSRVLASGCYLQGEECAAFEHEFAGYLESDFGIGAASGTDAVALALRACGIAPGDGVVTVSHTAVATVAAIDLVGAHPVLIDVESVTQTMNADLLSETILNRSHPKIRAVVPVHLYGNPAPMHEILSIARRHELAVIEDCAQSHGARVIDRKTGTFGDFGAFSFYPTKNLGALGDGGMLVTSDRMLADRARQLKQYGWRQRYISELPGMNTRLDEIQAAILRVKLPYLDAQNRRRREIAQAYDQNLAGTSLGLPCSRPADYHVYHQYVIRTLYRDELRAHLREDGIDAALLYPMPVHLQRGYRTGVRLGAGGLEVTEKLAKEILCLPIHPYLTHEQQEAVISSIHTWERWRHRT